MWAYYNIFKFPEIRNDQEVIGKWADIGPYDKKHVGLQGRDTRWVF